MKKAYSMELHLLSNYKRIHSPIRPSENNKVEQFQKYNLLHHSQFGDWTKFFFWHVIMFIIFDHLSTIFQSFIDPLWSCLIMFYNLWSFSNYLNYFKLGNENWRGRKQSSKRRSSIQRPIRGNPKSSRIFRIRNNRSRIPECFDVETEARTNRLHHLLQQRGPGERHLSQADRRSSHHQGSGEFFSTQTSFNLNQKTQIQVQLKKHCLSSSCQRSNRVKLKRITNEC